MNSNLKKLAIGICATQGTVYVLLAVYVATVLSVQPLTVRPVLDSVVSEDDEYEHEVQALPAYRPVITIQDLPSPRSQELIAEIERLLGNTSKYPSLRNERVYNTAEFECLAKNIYYEARHESLLGQVAVALVTMHRVNHKRFPSDVCSVVQQGGEITKNRCQFSWYCDGLSDNPKEHEAYQLAQQVAEMVLDPATVLPDFTQGADHYHADYIQTPCWATRMQKVAHVDTHIFYKELPEYTPCLPKKLEEPLQASL